jgi:hypothetical protein
MDDNHNQTRSIFLNISFGSFFSMIRTIDSINLPFFRLDYDRLDVIVKFSTRLPLHKLSREDRLALIPPVTTREISARRTAETDRIAG